MTGQTGAPSRLLRRHPRAAWRRTFDAIVAAGPLDVLTLEGPAALLWELLDQPKDASQLTGEARYRAYGALDVLLSRDAAPAIPVDVQNALSFVSGRVGCVVVNPFLNLTAICLN